MLRAALDYVLKPVTAARIRTVLDRVRQRRLERSALIAGTPRPEYLNVRLGTRVELIPTAQIDWLEADGDYVRAHVGPKTHLVSETLAALLARLDANMFVRIHRARAVNFSKIQSLQRGPHGEYIIHLSQGAAISAGRSYTAALNERFSRAP